MGEAETTPETDSSAATVATDETATETTVEGTIVEEPTAAAVIDTANVEASAQAEEITEVVEGAVAAETDEIPLAETFPIDEETN